jgi:hypothetical protein
MPETLLARLQRKLAEAAADKAEHKNVQDIQLDDDTRLDGDGRLTGGLSFRVRDSKGAWHVVHRERMDGLLEASELDDVLARGISIFLMKHPSWPQ